MPIDSPGPYPLPSGGTHRSGSGRRPQAAGRGPSLQGEQMHAKDFITASIGRQRWIADAVMQDLTEEQLNWSPPGLANKIATILVHVTGTDDRFINMRALGKP